jgi:CubicO group peptidase (beta-lactamase class C family)
LCDLRHNVYIDLTIPSTMPTITRLTPLLVYVVIGTICQAQQLKYTAAEAYTIHENINRSRWDIGGRLSHYSFRFMSEFFPTETIKKSNQEFTFTENQRNEIGSISIQNGAESETLEAQLKRLHVNSIVVVKKGEIVFEKYYSMLPEEQHTLQSVSKVITSTLIAKLENEGKIRTDRPIEQYIPELRNTAWQGIPVKDILDMRSGIQGSESDLEDGPFTNPNHNYYKFESALGLLPRAGSAPPPVYEHVASLKRKNPPGEKVEYHSVNTFVLGWLAEKLTGAKYSDLVSEWIWKTMGASSNAYVCLSEKGVPWTHGGVSTTLRDLARFGMLFTQSDIVARKESLVSQAQLESIFASGQSGYQWDWARKGHGIMKSGFGGQGLYVNPGIDLVIAFFNHIDVDWKTDNMISFETILEIEKAIERK